MSGVVIGEESLLLSVSVDYLAKIALLVEQPHADDWNAQIAGGLQLIAGHIAQPARVDGQRFAQHEFHAEIRNAAQRRLRVRLLKPRRRLRSIAPGLNQIVNFFAESAVSQNTLEFIPRDRLQHNPWVMRELPQHRIELCHTSSVA